MVSKTSSSWKLQLLLTTKYGIKDIVKLEITTLTNNKIWYQRHRLEITTLTNNKIWYQRHRQAGNYNSY